MIQLKGYRVRVVVDYPIWEYSREAAEKVAEQRASSSDTACKIIHVETLLVTKADNKKIFSEECRN